MLFLTEVAPNLWTAAQPLRFLGLEVGSRMTVVRLPSQDLVLISPVPLKNGDQKMLDSLGTVKHIVAPNLFHHLFLDEVHATYPEAQAYGVKALAEKRPELVLDSILDAPGSFEETLDYFPFKGFRAILPSGIKATHETVFHHRPSGTLIITDIAFNFDETFPFSTRLAAQVLGSYRALRPSRLEKWGTWDKQIVQHSIQKVLNWNFDRVIPAHGGIVETDGKAQLKAGFEWFLGRSL